LSRLGTTAAPALLIALGAAVLGGSAFSQSPTPVGPAQPAQPAGPGEPQRPTPVAPNPFVRVDAGASLTPDRLARAPLVLSAPAGESVEVRRDVIYRSVGGRPLRMDLYLPGRGGGLRPGVIFASGGSDPRDWASFRAYGRLAATRGLVGIVYEKRYERSQVLEGAEDTAALLEFLHDRGGSLGVDAARLVVWGFSAGGRLLAAAMDSRYPGVRAVIGFYGVLDLSADLPFYPDSLRARVRALASPVHVLLDRPDAVPPALIVRAGRDDATLNAGIDRFVHFAEEAKRPVELIAYPEGRHAFDVLDDRVESRRIIERAFQFAQEQVGAISP
jgi:dienelactone hydrolase